MKRHNQYLLLVGVLCAAALGGCSAPTAAPKSTASPETDNKLTINNFSIEQSNPQGKLYWRLKAKEAVYTLDKKVAKVVDLSGDLYQDAQIVMRLSAKTADVEQDGQRVLLRGDVTAKETRNNLVVVSQELEWRPDEDLLTISKNVQATHPKLRASGNIGKYRSRQQRLDMFDNIVALAPEEKIRLQTNHLQWQVDAQNIIGDRPVQIERFKENQLTEQVNANRISYSLNKQTVQLNDRIRFNSLEQNIKVNANSAEWNINQQVLELEKQIEFTAVKPPLQIFANKARWQIQQQLVTATQDLRIIHLQEQATFTANRGSIDLNKNVAILTGSTQGVTTRNQAKLNADSLIWQIDSQLIEGNGRVRYQQSNPALVLTGSKGVGRLQDQSVVVTGNAQQPVETQIVPTNEPTTP